MIDLSEFEAVVFDMDGLLIDTESVSKRVFFEACDEVGVSVDLSIYLETVGRPQRETRELILERCGADFPYDVMRAAYKRRYIAEAVEKPVPLMAGVIALLDWLVSAEIPIALATSTGSSMAPTKLSNANLTDYFQVIVTGDQIPNGKPAPDIYLRAAELLGVDPTKCVAFEDSENGVRAAVAAGMTTVQVPDMVPVSAELRNLNHIIIDSLSDLLHPDNKA